MTFAPAAPSLASQLLRALAPARAHAEATRAIDRLAGDPTFSPYAVRAALASVVDRPETSRALTFPAFSAAREALGRLDQTLDRVVLAAIATDPVDALARELARGLDSVRLERTLTVAFDALAPPASHARAVFIDLLRAHPLGPARVTVYLHLVARDTDVRAPLADDTLLDAPSRLAVLGAFAARLDASGRRVPLDFSGATRAALARTLADWSRHASHPRHVVFAFERALDDASRAAAELAQLGAWACPPEVRAWLAGRAAGGPLEADARDAGGGRFECAQCGKPAVHAVATRPLDVEDPSKGLETDYVCTACNTAHHAAWEASSASGASRALPRAWLAKG